MGDRISLLLVVAIINIGLGLLVYLKNPRHLVNKLFAFFVLCVSTWTLCIYMIYSATDINSVEIWGRSIFAVASLIALSFFYFSRVFPDRKWIPTDKLFLLFTGCGIIITLISPSNLIVKAIKLADHPTQSMLQYEPIFGPAHPIFAIYFLSCFSYGLVNLGIRWRSSIGIHRLQLQYLFLGTLLAGIGGMTTNLLIPLLFHTRRYGIYGPLFSIFMIAFTAHSIVRYRLMDIQLVLKKSLVYLTSILTVVAICAALIVGLEKVGQLHLSVIVVLLLAVSFEHIRKGFELLVNRYFYRATSNYQKTLRQATQALTSVLDLQQLLSYLTDIVLHNVLVESISVFLYDESNRKFESKLMRNYRNYLEEKRSSVISLPENSKLIKTLIRQDQPLIRDEIERRFPADLAKQLLAEMSNINAEVVFAMLFKGDLIGIVGMGKKLSGDPYFSEDLEILSLMFDQAASAVRNVQLYQQVRSLEMERNRAEQLALIGTVAASLVHEIKNPLVSIKTLAELLPEKFSDPEFRDYFSKIAMAEIDRVDKLLSQLRSLDHSMPSKLTAVEPIEVLEDTISLLKFKLMKQQVEVGRSYAPSLPKVKADISQLKQVFLNLLLNSIEAMEEPGEIGLSSFIISSTSSPLSLSSLSLPAEIKEKEMVGISISDTGRGIADEDLQKIFQPFFTTKKGGSGLGLAICDRIIESSKGKIAVQNNKNGRGVTVTIYLPIYAGEKETE